MSNIGLIAQREYITRVKSKTFILTTFLTPLGFLLFFALVGFIMSRGSDEQKNIIISDGSGLLGQEISLRKNFNYTFSSEDIEKLKEAYLNGDTDGILVVPPLESAELKDHGIMFFSDDRLALDEMESIERAVERKIRAFKVEALDLDEGKISLLDTNVEIDQQGVKDEEKDISATSTLVGSILGGVISYAMFFIIFLYGAQVMRSVMEEKINRIVEVLISSVKPFELMMGKILGVGAVGLTQIVAWIIILIVGFLIAGSIFGINAGPPEIPEISGMDQAQVAAGMNEGMDKVREIIAEIGKMNWFVILPLAIFYFLTGYFAYAAIFAAVGSAVGEDINEANSLTLPIMIPLMLAIYIGFAAVNAPNSSVAVWGSIIPLTSSIVMPVRLPIDPPFWQVLVSVVLLILFVLLMVWLAARIYRVGILMYGKKASFKELGKWLFYRG